MPEVTAPIPGLPNVSITYDTATVPPSVIDETLAAFSAIASTPEIRDWAAHLTTQWNFDVYPPDPGFHGGGGGVAGAWVQVPSPAQLYLGYQDGQYVFAQWSLFAILLHEIGHLVFRTPGSGFSILRNPNAISPAINDELQADAGASEILTRYFHMPAVLSYNSFFYLDTATGKVYYSNAGTTHGPPRTPGGPLVNIELERFQYIQDQDALWADIGDTLLYSPGFNPIHGTTYGGVSAQVANAIDSGLNDISQAGIAGADPVAIADAAAEPEDLIDYSDPNLPAYERFRARMVRALGVYEHVGNAMHGAARPP